jgi:hypothetical protein
MWKIKLSISCLLAITFTATWAQIKIEQLDAPPQGWDTILIKALAPKSYKFDINSVGQQTFNYSPNFFITEAKPDSQVDTLRNCWKEQIDAFKKQAPGIFKVLIIPLYGAARIDQFTPDFAFLLQRSIEEVATKNGLRIFCAKYNCGSDRQLLDNEEIERLKKESGANLILYGSYTMSCGKNDSAGICLNWLGDTVKLRNYQDTAKSIELGVFKNDKIFNPSLINIHNINSGQVKTSISFISYYTIGLSNPYPYYFFKALENATSREDSLLCMKQLAYFQYDCYADSADIRAIDMVLKHEPFNQNYLWAKAFMLYNRGDFQNAAPILKKIESFGLDTTIESLKNFNIWSLYMQAMAGNSQPLHQALDKNPHDVSLLDLQIGFYEFHQNLDSLYYYYGKVISELRPENFRAHLVPDSLGYIYVVDSVKEEVGPSYASDTFFMSTGRLEYVGKDVYIHVYAPPGDESLTNPLAVLREVTSEDDDTTVKFVYCHFNLDFKEEAYFLNRAICGIQALRFRTAFNDIDYVARKRPGYINLNTFRYDDAFFIKGYAHLYGFVRNSPNCYIESAISNFSSSIHLLQRTLDTTNYYNQYVIAMRYGLLGIAYHYYGKEDSATLYLNHYLSLYNNDSTSRYFRGLSLLTVNAGDFYTIRKAKADFEYTLAALPKLTKSNPYTASSCYLSIALCDAILMNNSSAKRNLQLGVSITDTITPVSCKMRTYSQNQQLINRINALIEANKASLKNHSKRPR